MMNASDNSLIIVEDNAADITHYLRLLEQVDHPFSHIDCVNTTKDAYDRIVHRPPACCLLDFNLPDGSALALLEQLEKHCEYSVCPVIIITGQENTQTAIKLMQHGAQDYLVKQNIDADKLERVIKQSIRTWKMQSLINHQALYDSLTGLVNRALFIDRLAQIFEESKRYKRRFALLYIDLDRFKAVNDTHGHEAGDHLLKSVSACLRSLTRSTDTVARLGGDEFAMLLPDIDDTQANHVTSKVTSELTMNIPWQDGFISVSPSIGLATYPSHASSYQELMREADFALYRAKDSGRGQYAAFNEELELESRQIARLSTALPKAIQNHDLQVAYQPIIDIQNGRVDSVEALVRWRFHEQWVPPEQIIDLVLQKRLSESFHDWIFASTIAQVSAWQQAQPQLNLALNLPADLCHDAKLLEHLLSAAKAASIEPSQITVEITETYLMRYPEEAKQRLMSLALHGVQIAIDDFGTGHSSMQYLAFLPCTKLKIDRQFFLDLQSNARNGQIIEAIASLAHRLRLKVVAEGIETEALLQSAKAFGCDYAQGYWIGAPVIYRGGFSTFCDQSKVAGDDLMGITE